MQASHITSGPAPSAADAPDAAQIHKNLPHSDPTAVQASAIQQPSPSVTPVVDSSSGAGSLDIPNTPAFSSPPPACAMKRIKHDLKMVMRDPLPGIFVHFDEHDITVAHCLIIGPFDTPYEGGMEMFSSFFNLVWSCRRFII
jgi:hypothetical protein